MISYKKEASVSRDNYPIFGQYSHFIRPGSNRKPANDSVVSEMLAIFLMRLIQKYFDLFLTHVPILYPLERKENRLITETHDLITLKGSLLNFQTKSRAHKGNVH